MRKAFLSLDTDYDGYITVEDILKYFGNEKDLNYNDLKKLMIDKDSKKQGRIGYSDFSKWLGNAIHLAEGFYFRHDSVKNPMYELNLDRMERNKKDDKHEAAQQLLKGDVEQMILEKMKFQWKTLRKAFMDLNIEKTGKISKKEFKFFLNFWGLDISEKEFLRCFNNFDVDKDGFISYKDFQFSIGSEMFPSEGLYFRQDKPQQQRIISCQHAKCFQPTKNNQNFCDVHQKMHQDESIQIFTKIYSQIATKWNSFIKDLKNKADKDDESQIYFVDFLYLIRKYGARLSAKEQEQLLQSFPGQEGGSKGERINVSRIFDQQYNIILDGMYKKVDMSKVPNPDEPVDALGYLGLPQWYRDQKVLRPIEDREFLAIICANNQMKEVMLRIKEIDKEHNGYVTRAELDDILKIIYKQKLMSRNLQPILDRFASIQNKILIDYKQFRDWIMSYIAKIELLKKQRNEIKELKEARKEEIQKMKDKVSAKTEVSQKDQELLSNEIKHITKMLRQPPTVQAIPRDDQKSAITLNSNFLAKQVPETLSTQRTRQFIPHKMLKSKQLKVKPFNNLVAQQRSSSTLQRKRPDSLLRMQSEVHSQISRVPNKSSIKSEIREGVATALQRMLKSDKESKVTTQREKSLYQKHVAHDYNNEQLLKKQAPKADNKSQRSNQTQLVSLTQKFLKTNKGRNGITAQNTSDNVCTVYQNNYLMENRQEALEQLKLYSEQGKVSVNDERKYNQSKLIKTGDELLEKIIDFAQVENDDNIKRLKNPYKQKRAMSAINNHRKEEIQDSVFNTTRKGGEEFSERKMRPNGSQSKFSPLVSNRMLQFIEIHKQGNQLTIQEKQIASKLAYEWKNMYRNFISSDPSESNLIDAKEFESYCNKFKVRLTNEELHRIK